MFIDLNPIHDGRKGVPRQLSCIVGGLLIENEEGRRWFKDTFGRELASNHSEDVSVMVTLWDRLEEHGIDASSVCLVSQCQECHSSDPNAQRLVCDFLVITYIERGPFWHDGVNGCEFVLDEQRKPLPGVKELQVAERIDTLGYKSLYSDLYYSWLARG